MVHIRYNLARDPIGELIIGGVTMAVDYSRLWKLLIDRKLNKTQLKDLAHISTNAIAKLVRDENVSLDTLEKICKALDCKIEDIMDFIEKEEC